jgi:uncharacterized protein (TIRG00374 family)
MAAARWLLIAAGLAVIGYLFVQIGPSLVWDALSSLSWWLPVLLVFPACVIVLLDTLAWRFTFTTPPKFRTLLAVRLAGDAVNLSTPTASVGGEPVKAYLLRAEVPLQDGFASVIADKTTLVAAQVVLLAVGLLAGLGLLPLAHPLMRTMVGALVLETLCVGGFIVVQLAGVGSASGRLMAKLGMAPTLARQTVLEGLDRALRAMYGARRARILASLFCHFLASALETFEIYLVLRRLGIPISLTTSLTIGAFGSAARFFSFMIPASLGALEGAYVAIFAAFGIGGAVGLTCTIVRRLREILWVGAGFAVLTMGRSSPIDAVTARRSIRRRTLRSPEVTTERK